LITSSSGCFSSRLSHSDVDELAFIITPTEVDRRELVPEDLCYVSTRERASIPAEEPRTKAAKLAHSDLWFHPLHAPGDPEAVNPSRAAAVHGQIYKMHPEIQHILIAQPTFATSYCITGRPFRSDGIPESHIILQTVQTVPIYAVLLAEGLDLAKALDPSAGKNTVLVEGYGLVSIGKDLLKTFIQIEVCESMCGKFDLFVLCFC
jgi:ribulose-5-phosphate 4-epimerase/fuculose-1-phosphate aldolase